jgi:hypothetical protein
MTPTLKSDWFTQTSDEPYDRHHYELHIKEQEKTVVFEDYDLLRSTWFQTCHLGKLSHVNVIDATKVRTSRGQGF